MILMEETKPVAGRSPTAREDRRDGTDPTAAVPARGLTAGHPAAVAAYQKAAAVLAGGAMLVGVLSLVGLIWGLDALTRIAGSTSSIKANAAVSILLAGVALWLLSREPIGTARRRIGQGMALLVVLVGLLTLVEFAFGWSIGIDQALLREEPGAFGTRYPGRMAIAAAVDLVLLGAALFLLGTRAPAGIAQWLACIAGLISLLPFTGYLYGADFLSELGVQVQMSLPAAAGLLLLSLGVLLARPDQGLMTAITSDTSGGAVSRRLLPAALLLPLLLGWIRLSGQRAGLYGTELGLAVFALANISTLVVLVILNARRLYEADQRRTRDEEERERLLRREQAARAEAEAASARFRGLVESGPDAILMVDEEGRITLVNSQAERLFGYPREELLGKPVEVLVPERFRERHVSYRAGYVAAPRTRPMGVGLDLYALRRDGTELPVEISLSPLSTEQGLQVIAGIRDITARKQAEEQIRSLNRALEQRAAALEATNKELEAFSYSVSHDLRAPLRSIDGFSQALLEDYGDTLDAMGQDYLRRVRAATQRMGQLIDDILKLSRITRAEMRSQTVDLSALAHAVAEELQQRDPQRRVEWRIAEGVIVQGDPPLLRVVLENLLGNAWKFTSKREEARIEFGVLRQDDQPVYYVRDNGAGFDMARVDKLFRPFQRLHTEEEFPGTGIGLATVQRIILRHGGRIWAEGAVGQGATFYFTLS